MTSVSCHTAGKVTGDTEEQQRGMDDIFCTRLTD